MLELNGWVGVQRVNLESNIKTQLASLKAVVKSLYSAQSQLESKVAEMIGGVKVNSLEIDIKIQFLPQVRLPLRASPCSTGGTTLVGIILKKKPHRLRPPRKTQ